MKARIIARLVAVAGGALILLAPVVGCGQKGGSAKTTAEIKDGMLHPNNSKDINDVPAAQRDMVRAIIASQQKGQAPDIGKKPAAAPSPAASK